MKPDTLSESGYRVTEDADLSRHNSFRVPARAQWLIEVDDARALPEVFELGAVKSSPVLVLGEGSNVLLTRGWPGVVLVPAMRGIRILEDRGDAALVRVGAGENWNEFVHWSLGRGFAGLENLILIPGSVGAAPIQNIGAYGVEVRERIRAVEAFDRRDGAMVRLDNAACGFAYRDSLFKRDPERFVVTAVEFALPRTPALRLDYAGIGEELAAMGVADPTPSQVADAVIRIRRRKLPDPAVLGNAGSFFKNPIVPAVQAEALHARHPSLPTFRGNDDGTRKLSAAWLIDQCGWKGHREGDAGVAASHALVLVNHGHATGMQLLDLARRIAASVRERFGVDIEPEPRIVGAKW